MMSKRKTTNIILPLPCTLFMNSQNHRHRWVKPLPCVILLSFCWFITFYLFITRILIHQSPKLQTIPLSLPPIIYIYIIYVCVCNIYIYKVVFLSVIALWFRVEVSRDKVERQLLNLQRALQFFIVFIMIKCSFTLCAGFLFHTRFALSFSVLMVFWFCAGRYTMSQCWS